MIRYRIQKKKIIKYLLVEKHKKKCKPISKGIPRVINIEKHKINNHIEETVGPDPKPNKIALPYY